MTWSSLSGYCQLALFMAQREAPVSKLYHKNNIYFINEGERVL